MNTNPAALCPGCFQSKGRANPCPHCGFDETAPRPVQALPLGTLLHDQFGVGRVLGKPGGFGITYLARDRLLEAIVAIKEYLPRELVVRAQDSRTLHPHSNDETDLFRYGLEQFLAEARTLAKLDHPNLVRVRQFFEANGTAYLVMDYYQGCSLAEHLERLADSRMSEPDALALMQPILDGLRAVHAKGFLHRDIKPQNIYLAATDSGGVRPILLDFGAARQAMGERSRSLSVVISPGYAPYEQYHRKGQQSPATDIYGAAAVLYRMLTGQAPPEATERVAEDELPPPADFGVSITVSRALLRGLAMTIGERPITVAAFQQMLETDSAAQADTAHQTPQNHNTEADEKAPEGSISKPTIADSAENISEDKQPEPLLPNHRSGRHWIVVLLAFLGLVVGGGVVVFVSIMSQPSLDSEPPTNGTPETAETAESTETMTDVSASYDHNAFAAAKAADTIPAYQAYLDDCAHHDCAYMAEAERQIGLKQRASYFVDEVPASFRGYWKINECSGDYSDDWMFISADSIKGHEMDGVVKNVQMLNTSELNAFVHLWIERHAITTTIRLRISPNGRILNDLTGGSRMRRCPTPDWLLEMHNEVPAVDQVQETELDSMSTYTNSRFGFILRYPNRRLIPQGESGSGDGQLFLSKDGKAEVRVFGRRNSFEQTIGAAYREALSEDGANGKLRTVTYKRLGDNWFVLSGYEEDRIFYVKEYLINNIFYILDIQYPETERDDWDPLVGMLNDEFRTGGSSN